MTLDCDYDKLIRQTDVTQTIAGLTPTITFARQYDAAGRLISNAAAIGGTDDFLSDYVYDALGRLATLIQTDQNNNAVADKRVDFTYNLDSQVASILRYAGMTTASPVASTEFTYDAPGRIDLIHHLGLATGSTFDEEHDYGYDDADRLTSYANLIDGILAEYDYDAAGQLTEADYDALLPDEAYDYDDNGNRELVDNFGGTAQDYDAGPYNRLASDGTYEYAYDDEGNIVSREGVGSEYGHRFYYTWDHRNRLTKVSEWIDDHEVVVVDYVYDALNQLVARLVDKPFGDGYSGTVFVHDGGQVVLQFDDAFGLTPSDLEAEDLSHRYLWGPAVDQLLADEQVTSLSSAGEVLWAMADHLGSVTDVIDSNGDLRIHKVYDTFGNIVDETHYNTSGSTVTSGQAGYVTIAFGFTGRYFDADTVLQNNLNRWYDATIGRWLSEDPIGFAADDPNLYRYVGNMPTMYADPMGLSPFWTNSLSSIPGPWFPLLPGLGMPIVGIVVTPPAQLPNDGSGLVITIINSWKWIFGDGRDKGELTADTNKLLDITTLPNVDGIKYRAKQGHHIGVPIAMLGPNDVVGTNGAGPCIGVIIRECNGPNSNVFAAHFEGDQNPVATISDYFDPYYAHEHPNSPYPDVYIFGGDNSAISNTQLGQTIDAFDQIGIPWIYINTTGLWIDQNGRLYLLPVDKPSEDMNNKW